TVRRKVRKGGAGGGAMHASRALTTFYKWLRLTYFGAFHPRSGRQQARGHHLLGPEHGPVADSTGSTERGERAPIARGRLIEQDVAGAQRPREREPVERAAAGERHVGLPMRECAASQIYIRFVQRQSLALVDGERPGQPKRELAERAGDRLHDL